jgi:hypothetical protein
LVLNCPQCAFANEIGDAYCGGCGRNLTRAAPPNTPSEPITHRQASSSQHLPQTFLEEILKEETHAPDKNVKDDKKAVTQEEIDKLFDKNK